MKRHRKFKEHREKPKKFSKQVIYTVIIASIMIFSIIGFTATDQQIQVNGELFSTLVTNSLYLQGFCSQNITEVEQCAEVFFPIITIRNVEAFDNSGKILLVNLVTEDIYKEIPALYKEQIIFVFENENKEITDTIYVKKGKWSRTE